MKDPQEIYIANHKDNFFIINLLIYLFCYKTDLKIIDFLTIESYKVLNIFHISNTKYLKGFIEQCIREENKINDYILRLINNKNLKSEFFFLFNINSVKNVNLSYSIAINSNEVNVVNNCNTNYADSDKNQFIYNVFLRDRLREFKNNLDLELSLAYLLKELNVWHGDLKVLNQIEKSVFIEESSNDFTKTNFKTLSKTLLLKLKISPYNIKQDSISLVSNEIVELSITRVLELNRDLALNYSFLIDINYENNKNRFSLLPKTGTYGTIIDKSSKDYLLLEKIFDTLSTS